MSPEGVVREVRCPTCEGSGRLSVADYIDTPPRIVQTPGICGGVPRIDGTRISVAAITGLAFVRGLTVEQIAELYPELTEAHVKEAIEYVGETA